MSAAPPRLLRSFGRIKARPLKSNQVRLLETLLPEVALDLTAPVARADRAPLGLEIGFGGGEHLVAQAKARPDWRFIGVEPFLNGVGACLVQLEAAGAANIRIHQGDARDVVAALPDGRVSQVWILFPDPWPKKRHHKRRLIQPDFVADLARVVATGGHVRFATDWADYAAWTLATMKASPAFAWTAQTAADWRQPWADHVTTRYEAKRLGDTAPLYFEWRRV